MKTNEQSLTGFNKWNRTYSPPQNTRVSGQEGRRAQGVPREWMRWTKSRVWRSTSPISWRYADVLGNNTAHWPEVTGTPQHPSGNATRQSPNQQSAKSRIVCTYSYLQANVLPTGRSIAMTRRGLVPVCRRVLPPPCYV